MVYFHQEHFHRQRCMMIDERKKAKGGEKKGGAESPTHAFLLFLPANVSTRQTHSIIPEFRFLEIPSKYEKVYNNFFRTADAPHSIFTRSE